MTPEEILEESRLLRQALRRFATRRAWLRHADGPALQRRVDALLGGVHSWVSDGARATRTAQTLRFVHWNILHGCDHQAVLGALQSDPALRDADLISLNEVDIGMQRSGNIDVGRTLARHLGLHGAWCALFLEVHGGLVAPHPGRPRPPRPDDDQQALFGLCLLSRYPLTEPQRLVLETPADLLFDREGKVGDFVALRVTVQHPVRPFQVVVTHLDVHGTPARRRRQMQHILQAFAPGPALVSGDFNTTTFARGTLQRTLSAFATLALLPRPALQRRLQHPDSPRESPREPLFADMRQAGFDWSACNDTRETLDLLLKDVQEVQRLPHWLRTVGQPLLRHVERRTRHRLDWIVARGLQVCVEPSPVTRVQWMRGDRPASDHAPIACTFNVEAAAR